MNLTPYVEKGCTSCERARGLVQEIAKTYAWLEAQVLDIAKVREIPEAVIAVPAYALEGRLVSLGNPSLDELCSIVEKQLKRLEAKGVSLC